MKQRGKLLRLRPFNMANFSSGAGHLMMFGMFFSWIIILPSMFFVWAGFALPMKSENGEVDYQILIRRLDFILLPICVGLFCLLFFGMTINAVSESDGSLLLAFWVAAFPTLGIFFAARASASALRNSKADKFTKGKWLLYLLLFAILLIIVGALGAFLLGIFLA